MAENSDSLDALIRKYTGDADTGEIEVLLSIAATASGVEIDTATDPCKVTPPNLLDLAFNDPAVGLATSARMSAWKANLARMLPMFRDAIREIPENPSLRIRDVTRFVAALRARGEREGAAGPRAAYVAGPETEARRAVANRLGQAFASKASPALLRALAGSRREALETNGTELPLVLEFQARPRNPVIAPSTVVSREPGAHRYSGFNLAREGFFQQVGTVRTAVERTAGCRSVEVCSLNSTVRACCRAMAVAEAAGETSLAFIDLPRRIRREIAVATQTIGLVQFRQRFPNTGLGVRVAVIDGEVDLNHPALRERVVLKENFSTESFGAPDPHGTAVAGIIAARDVNLGGIAPDATILNYKIFTTDPSSTIDDFYGALAIEHALRDGADVANCSWGVEDAPQGTSREARACNAAWSQGLILVKSAGNGGPYANSMTSPADADGIIVVGATDRHGTGVQDYSGRGPTTNGKRPHLVAPGGTPVEGLHSVTAGGGFGDIGYGTSFAAPVVTGTIALLLNEYPNASPDDIRNRLVELCRPFANNEPNAHGAGLLDLAAFSRAPAPVANPTCPPPAERRRHCS
jgi:serine protease AprX